MSGWQAPAERSDQPAPAPGEAAPAFALGHAGEPDRIFALADALREKPVALLFGSYT